MPSPMAILCETIYRGSRCLREATHAHSFGSATLFVCTDCLEQARADSRERIERIQRDLYRAQEWDKGLVEAEKVKA